MLLFRVLNGDRLVGEHHAGDVLGRHTQAHRDLGQEKLLPRFKRGGSSRFSFGSSARTSTAPDKRAFTPIRDNSIIVHFKSVSSE